MKTTDFTDEQLQKIRCHYKKVKLMAPVFEGGLEENTKYIEDHTLPPTKYLKEIVSIEGQGYIQIHILNLGYPACAKLFGVSIPFLKKLAKPRKEVNLFTDVGNDIPDSIFDSRAVAKIFGKTVKGDLGVNARTSSHFGRSGEEFYQKFSPDATDMNSIDPRYTYDFDDPKYGKVNVKTSKLYTYQSSGAHYWYFSANTGEETEYFACVGCDAERAPLWVIMVPVNSIKENFIRIKESELYQYVVYSSDDILKEDNCGSEV